MLETYDDYLEELETHAVRDGYGEFSLAREEFHNNTGVFEDGEPWFEVRMKMFMDWYLLERIGHSGMTPLQSYLSARGASLSPKVFRQMLLLAVSHRSAFNIVKREGRKLVLDDLAAGGRWEAVGSMPTVGLEKEDIVGARLVLFNDAVIMGGTTVLHPKEAREDVLAIVARARAEGMPPRELVDHLDKMRLKLDRYSNVRIQHIYRFPGDSRL